MNQMTLFTPTVRRLLADPFFGPFDLSPAFAPVTNGAPSRSSWTPPTDVHDSGAELRIDLELPGVRREDISVRVHDGRLTIEGRRVNAVLTQTEAPGDSDAANLETRPQSPEWSRRERFSGVFRRTFALPDTVDVSRIHAGTSNGVLSIVLPKLEKAQPREIEVQVH